MNEFTASGTFRFLVGLFVLVAGITVVMIRRARGDQQVAEEKWHEVETSGDPRSAEDVLTTVRRIVSDHAGHQVSDGDLGKDFQDGLRIPPADIFGLFESVEKEFGIAIAKADEAKLQSVTALALHVAHHLEDSQRRHLLTGQ